MIGSFIVLNTTTHILEHSHEHGGFEGALFHAIEHTLPTVPLLFAIYLLIHFINHKKGQYKYSALSGSLLGVIPQCGFSTITADYYNKGFVMGGTLIAVFLSTSDEFIPVILAVKGHFLDIVFIIFIKLIFAIIIGTILNKTLFKSQADTERFHGTCIETGNIFIDAFKHTVKIALVILISNLIIELLFSFIDVHILEKVLLSGNIFQPFLTALIGLIPGCYISILITELYLAGALSIGSTVAALSTAAGFGYVILFKKGVKHALRIIILVYLCASSFGFLLNIILNHP